MQSKAIEVAFLSVPAIEFFAEEQYQALQDWYLALGQGLEPLDATVKNDRGPLPTTFLLHDLWMFGCTKPTSEVTAVAQTPLCRYQLGLGTYNVQLLSRGWMEVSDHTFCICAGSYCGLSSFPAISKENLTTGLEVQQSPLPRNSMDASGQVLIAP